MLSTHTKGELTKLRLEAGFKSGPAGMSGTADSMHFGMTILGDKAGKFGRILGKFKIYDGKNDRQTTINEWMIENHYAVAYLGQSKESIASEHLINYEKVIENVDLTENELALYINSRC